MNGELKWDAKEETLAKYNTAGMPVAKSSTDDLANKPDYLKQVRNRTQASAYGSPAPQAIQQHTKEYYAVISEMDDALGRLFETIDQLGLRKNTYIIFMSDNGWMLVNTDLPVRSCHMRLQPRCLCLSSVRINTPPERRANLKY